MTNGEKKSIMKKINDLYCSPKIIRVIKSRMRWARNVAYMGESRGLYRFLFGNLKGNISLGGQHRHRWNDNIKMDLKVGNRGMERTYLYQDRAT